MSTTKYHTLLRPLAWLYGKGVEMRNFCFERGLLPSESFPIPIICVGNIAIGGTGKTPHIEYLLRLLTPTYRVAVLSRGYKRKTRGLVVATHRSTAKEIGDEPRQLKQKYPEAQIIVDGNRRRAVRHLLSLPIDQRPEVILMDDGFQHRYLRPSFSILLVDARRPVWDDRLLPEGRLREPISALYRADCVIVTKCGRDMTPMQQRIIARNLALYAHQHIFFSRMRRQCLQPALVAADLIQEQDLPTKHDRVLALSGIARPEDFWESIAERFKLVDRITFPDHHRFSQQDIHELNRRYGTLRDQDLDTPLYVICTEKDAMRLSEHRTSLLPGLVAHLYYLPIEVEIMQDEDLLQRLVLQAVEAKPNTDPKATS